MQAPKSFQNIKSLIARKKPAINEVVREPTAGGIVYRITVAGAIEFLLIQDAKDRWTIPKGHLEPGETARQTAEREIREETGLQQMEVGPYLGKINFRYRRQQSLVLMTTEIFLVHAKGDTNDLKKEEWMNGIKWHSVMDALEGIEYEDISKLMLLAQSKIRGKK
jgi:ADP-ribose pyrophosphatase YjhB (NUDIX family)